MRDEVRPLTSLRFAAALWVFIFHVDIRWPLPAPAWAKAFVEQGAVGMSLFFILSGYVMAYTYSDGVVSPKSFFLRRFARIYPVYVLAALATLPFFSVSQTGFPGFLEGTFVVFANIFMLQAWIPPMFNYWNVGSSWSLSAEAFFYALFPLAIAPIGKATNRAIWLVVAVSFVLSVLPGLSYVVIPNSKPIFYAVPIFRLPEFLVGICCAALAGRGALRLTMPGLVCASAFTVLAGALIVIPTTDIYVTANFAAVPCLALIIVSAAQMRGSVLDHPVPVFLGRISYAFYMMQPAVLMTAIAMQANSPKWPTMPVLLLSFGILVAVSTATYLLVEEPLRKKITQKRPPAGQGLATTQGA